MHQSQRIAPAHVHVSTNGCPVDAVAWERRKADAAEMVRRRFLTLREACEHYGLSEADIVGTAH